MSNFKAKNKKKAGRNPMKNKWKLRFCVWSVCQSTMIWEKVTFNLLIKKKQTYENLAASKISFNWTFTFTSKFKSLSSKISTASLQNQRKNYTKILYKSLSKLVYCLRISSAKSCQNCGLSTKKSLNGAVALLWRQPDSQFGYVLSRQP